jgi:hypothetical protein
MPNSSKRIEFAVPDGFAIPDGTDPGKPFDLVCSFEPTEGGDPDGTGKGKMVCMTKFGNMDAPGYKDGKKSDTDRTDYRPDYSQYSKGMMDDMQKYAPAPGSA